MSTDQPTITGHIDRVTGKPATAYTPPEDRVPVLTTLTDPAEIRATDEPDERTPNEVHVDESGCSCKTGPYRGFQRDPIDAACPKHGEPLRHGDGDVTACHPDGSTTIIREPDERGDFPCCTAPAPVGAAAALDLDAARAMLNAANTIKATGGAVEIGGVRIEPCDEYGSTVTTARAESAEAEVGTLRDTLARRTDSHTQLVRENEALRAKVAEGRRIVGMLAEAVESECEDDPEMCHEHDRTDDGRCPLLVDLNRAHAALAVTTGVGQ